MSFILDALKKSESERQQQGQSAFAHVPVGGGERRPPTWLWALGALLLVNLAVLTGLLLRPSAPAEPVASVSQTLPDQPSAVTETRFEDRVRDAINSRPAAPVEQVTVVESTPEVRTAPQAESAAPATAASSSTADTTGIPDIDQLRASGGLPIGDLRLDIHVYSDNPDDRFVFINMVKHREGSSTSDGLVVRTITEEGVILSYRGTDFVLPRQ